MRVAALLACLGSLIGVVHAQTQSSANIDDAVISMRVKAALIADPATKASQINVESQRGVVQLSGFVDSANMLAAADQIARGVKGVTEVRNELMVRAPVRTLGNAVDDTVIAAKIKSEIAGKAGLGVATRVNVEVDNGVVALSGFVASQADKNRAARIAGAVEGVKDVRNDIALKPQS